uniref:hypothetical protein n=1 Tax=Gluconobacter thailandicus TaxID=257438 RepID=UPI000ADFD32C|nr:hypothetical protein [Gluconobacter thailandicus]
MIPIDIGLMLLCGGAEKRPQRPCEDASQAPPPACGSLDYIVSYFNKPSRLALK